MDLIKLPSRSTLFTFLLAALCTTSTVTIHAQNINTIVGSSFQGFSGDGGAATAAQISGPNTCYISAAGDIYFCDCFNNVVRKISTTGIITTVAGVAGAGGYAGDGGQATAALLSHPSGIVGDAAGNLYISDMFNYRVRKVNASGVITTIAGNGQQGYSGDGDPGTQAELNRPYGLALDSYGNLYICDQYNHVVRKLTPSGIISTFAGTGNSAYSGDGGPANAADLWFPNQVVVDPFDNVFISDNQNQVIRKVDNAGIITTYAGTGWGAFSGDGGAATAAELHFPAGLEIDLLGNLYIADAENHRIRKVTPSGIITTIAGTSTSTYSGDGGPAAAASLSEPNDVVVDNAGNVIIVDFNNNRLRKIDYGNTRVQFSNGPTANKNVCKNSSAIDVDSLLGIIDPNNGQVVTWVLHTPPSHGTATINYSSVSTGAAILPTGLSYTPSPGYVGTDSFVIWVNDGLSVDTCVVHVAVVDCSVDVETVNNELKNGLEVYPNPGSGMFTIKFASRKDDLIKVVVTDMTGKKLQEFSAYSNTNTTVRLDIPAGVYFITVYSSYGKYVSKLVVE